MMNISRSLLFSSLFLFTSIGLAEPPEVDTGHLINAPATPEVKDITQLEGDDQATVADPDLLEGGELTVEKTSDLDALEGDVAIQCDGSSVCIETETKLPLRVLPRPFSHLYSQTEAIKDNIAQANIAAFHPWYVFQRQAIDLSDPAAPKGWYQVGKSKDKATGWLRAADAFEWRQALLVSYTHPGDPGEGRRPALMFSDVKSLENLIESEDMSEAASVDYDLLDEGKTPDGVISMEPKRFVDISKDFYLLPILNFKKLEIDGDDVRLLQLAAAVPGARGADTLEDEDYSGQARTGRDSGNAELVDKMKVDMVFVIDTTRSMQPYIDLTRDAMRGMVQGLGKKLNDRIRFGLVGYRDALSVAPKIEYTTKNFTPELVDGAELAKLLDSKAKATSVGSHDYQEEAFAGIEEALSSSWREDAMKFIVLIGDASSHIKGHMQNTTGKGADELLRDVDGKQIHIIALHLKDPRAEKDFALAETQFKTLSTVRGSEGDSAYLSVNAFKKDEFSLAVDSITSRIGGSIEQAIAKANKGQKILLGEVEPSAEELANADDVGNAAKAAFDKAWSAALIEYLGQGARPPKDIVAWVMDRDLVDPTLRTLDVRLLINRTQLSSLVQALDRVVQALIQTEISQKQFFQALQSVAGQAMKRPEDLAQAQKLVDTGLLPAFVNSLPYKSSILSLTDERFANMSVDSRTELQWTLLAKLKQYREINEQVDQWHRLNETDSDSDMVYPLNIDYLP